MNQEEGKRESLGVSRKVPFICCGQILSSNALYFMFLTYGDHVPTWTPLKLSPHLIFIRKITENQRIHQRNVLS